MKKKLSKKMIAIIAVLLLIIIFVSLVNFITDLEWFNELGYSSVFLKQLITEMEFGIPAFIIITVVCFIYLLTIKKAYYKKMGSCENVYSEKRVNRSALLISGIFGLITAFAVASRLWFQILQFVNSSDFGITDPIFGQDVSFYIFKLEFLQSVNSLLLYIIIGFAVVNLIYYLRLLTLRRPRFLDEVNEGSGQNTGQEDSEEAKAGSGRRFNFGDGAFGQAFNESFGGLGNSGRSTMPGNGSGLLNRQTLNKLFSITGLQIKVLGVLFFLLIALFFYLKQYSLLYTGSSGVVYGAGFADINIMLWVYRFLIVLSVAGAVSFVIGFNRRKLILLLSAPVMIIGVFIVGNIVTTVVQNLVVEPDELNKEYPYLENNIAFTRYAYDIDDITIADYDVKYNLTIDDIINNRETISNIRINDYEPALKYYNQTQSIRLYYNFNDVDVDRYWVDGEYTQTFLSAREIDEEAISSQWLTEHIKYTHGYGITLSRVDKITDSGQPDMLIDSIPPVSDVPEISITRPEIYFGEQTNNYIIVNTNEDEFDYPSGDNNVYTTYSGNAGIGLNFINRLMFAIREANIQILVSTNINKDSRILINRNIMDRITTIAPFLSYDDDPYIVVSDEGALYWILDAYTTSSYYPYSEPYIQGSANYVRNSIKVVVDAYNGNVDFYVVDNDDPIAITLQKIYPKLFKDFEQMPADLKNHIRYPDKMFSVQAAVYTKYHMTDVDVFYQNEDTWDIATEIYGVEQTVMSPSYYIMKLPGESNAEFINSIPYTPSGKYNLTALLVARNDGENYGNLVLYQMPKDRIIYGPQQVESKINQHTEIAQDFTLWNSAGSTYTRGNMFIIPIAGSLMYVEPIYLESASSSLPEVKRVILYYNERIAYEKTLSAALDSMFGEGAGRLASGAGNDSGNGTSTENDDDLTMENLAELANEAFNNAIKAQQSGDWSAYGRYLDQLEDYLSRMIPQSVTTVPDAGLTEQSAPAE